MDFESEEDGSSMSLTELLLKELEAEVSKPENLAEDYSCRIDFEAKKKSVVPPILTEWQSALLNPDTNGDGLEPIQTQSLREFLEVEVSEEVQKTSVSSKNTQANTYALSCNSSQSAEHNQPPHETLTNLLSRAPIPMLNRPPPSPSLNRLPPHCNTNGPPPHPIMSVPPPTAMMGAPPRSMNIPFRPPNMMLGPPGPMTSGPPGYMLNRPPGPISIRPPGLIPNGPPPNIMNRPPGLMPNGQFAPFSNRPPFPNTPLKFPMVGGPPNAGVYPGSPVPGNLNMHPMSSNQYNPMMGAGLPCFSDPGMFSNFNASLYNTNALNNVNLPIPVASIPDTTLATQLKAKKKKRQRKENAEASNPTTVASLSNISLPLSAPMPPLPPGPPPASPKQTEPPPPPPDVAALPTVVPATSPKKTEDVVHYKEHKIVMKVARRTLKEPVYHKAAVFKNPIVADYESDSDGDSKESQSVRKKALHKSITSVRLGEHEALPELYSKLRKLNEELAMLQQDEKRQSEDSSDDSDDSILQRSRKPRHRASKTRHSSSSESPERNLKHVTNVSSPSDKNSLVSPVRPNLDIRIKMMMDDKMTPPIKKVVSVNVASASEASVPDPPQIFHKAHLSALGPNPNLEIVLPHHDDPMKLLSRSPSPFLSREIYQYWHKESLKFRKIRKRTPVQYVDSKLRHKFHQDRYASVQCKPLRSQAAINIYTLLDSNLKKGKQKQEKETEMKKALISKEIEEDLKRLEAINRELQKLEEEEADDMIKNECQSTKLEEEAQTEEEAEDLMKDDRQSIADEASEHSNDTGEIDQREETCDERQLEDDECSLYDSDLKRLEELNTELQRLQEEEQRDMEVNGSASTDINATKRRLLEINRELQLMEAEDNCKRKSVTHKKFHGETDMNYDWKHGRANENHEEETKILQEKGTEEINAYQDIDEEIQNEKVMTEVVACDANMNQQPRLLESAPDSTEGSSEEESFPHRSKSQPVPADQQLVSLVMQRVMQELKQDLRRSITKSLVGEDIVDSSPVPFKKRKTHV